MTSTDVRDRARSLADLPNSQLITNDDEINSLNESYHDVYDWLLQNDDDYYLTEITVSLTASMISVTNLQANEYLVPLPSDFYRIRYLDWQSNNQWQPVYKMSLGMRDVSPASPMYRIRGAYLWLTGGTNLGSYTIRIGYYPKPVALTVPLANISYGTSYTPATLFSISEAFYTSLNQTMVYVLNSTTIVAESFTNNTIAAPVSIYSTPATSITEIQYYKGYLYWQTSTLNVYRALTNLSATISSTTSVTSSGTVTDFAIFNDLMYVCTATSIVTYTVAGTLVSTLGGGLNGPIAPTYLGGYVFYIDASNSMRYIGGTGTLYTNISGYIATDGVNLFFLDTSNNFMVASFSLASGFSVFATLSTDVRYIGLIEKNITSPVSSLDQVYVPILTKESNTFLAMGGSPPYNFSYPNNLFTEVMAYQMAMDFKSKAGQDPSMLAGRLGSRDVGNQCTGLWLRFYQSIKRDDHQPERINNRYIQPWGIW